MKKQMLSGLSAAFGFVIFLIALWVIRRELHGYTIAEIFAAASDVPGYRLLLALFLTACCYLMLTGYDILAVHSITQRPRYRSIILNSFICHAMSINVGCASLVSGSIRCHFFLRKGVNAHDVVRIVTFCLVTFWLGFFALGGTIFLLAPPAIPSFIHLPFSTLQPFGLLFLAALGMYFFIMYVRREPITVRGWVIPVMPARITLLQIAVSVSEWLLGSAVLYVLFPHQGADMYVHLLGFYFLAQVSGLVSQVPGGLGVFESILLAFAPADVEPSRILGSLLLYRLIFNLLPLTIAGTFLLIREVRYRKLSS